MSPLVLVLLLAAPAPAAVTPGPGPLAAAQELFEAQKFDQVIAALASDRIEGLSRQERPKAYLLLGASRARKGDIDGALGVFQLGVQLFPKDINLLSALADLLHRLELDDRAKPLYERVLRIHPNNAAAHLGLAEIEHAQGFLERSTRHYEVCLEELSRDASAWRAFAAVLSERRDYPKAIAAIEKSLSLEPGNPQSLEALALFQHRQGLLPQADDTIRKAIAAAPDPKELRLERALWLLERGSLDASLREVQQVLRDNPDNPLALWVRGSVTLRRGGKEEAVKDLKRAASKPGQYPFIASVAEAMLSRLGAER